MEDAEQRHLSMALIYIFLFCRRGSRHRNLKHLPNVFFLINFAYTQNLSKKEPYDEKLLYGPFRPVIH